MTSVASRPRSQPSFKGAFNASNSVSPQKPKTRVIYKNAKVDDVTPNKNSLYQESYNNQGAYSNNLQALISPKKSQKVTLADIRSQPNRGGTAQSSSSQGRNDIEGLKSQGSNRSQVQSHSGKGVSFAANNVNSQSNGKSQPALANATSSQGFNQGRYTYEGVFGEGTSHEQNQKNYESQLLKDAMSTAFCNHEHVNVNDEAEYYEAVKRLDVCGRCWAAQQKYATNPFTLKHKGPGQSLYQRDFVKHPLGDQGPVLKNDFYTTKNNNIAMDFTTTNRNDFKPNYCGAPKREKMNSPPATTGIPFGGKSHSRSEYVNWGPNTCAHEKAPHQLNIIPELPFNGATSYGQNFAKPAKTTQLKPVDRDLWRKSPLTPAIPFLGESTNAATYKPFKVSEVPTFKEAEPYEPTQALPEHQKSLYARDFPAPNRWVCPAVIFMQNNPHPRYQHLEA